MEKSLIKSLVDFLKEENIKMKLRTISDSEFWIEGSYGFLTAKFQVDERNNQILYDVFSPKYDIHLIVECLRDVERLDFIAEETGKWKYEQSIEDFWLILDCVKLWAQKNRFRVEENRLI